MIQVQTDQGMASSTVKPDGSEICCAKCGTPTVHGIVVGGLWICHGCEPEASKEFAQAKMEYEQDE